MEARRNWPSHFGPSRLPRNSDSERVHSIARADSPCPFPPVFGTIHPSTTFLTRAVPQARRGVRSMKRPSLPRTFLGAALLAFGVTFAGAAGRVNGQADGSEKVYQKTLKSTVWVVVPV